MSNLDLTQPAIFAAVASISLLAGLVRGFAGFGGPAIIILALVPFFSPLTLIPKVAVIDSVANLRLLPTTILELNWRLAAGFSFASLLGTPIGFYGLQHLDPLVMKRVIASIVAICILLMMLGWRLKKTPNVAILALAGFIAGIVLGGTLIAFVAALCFLSLPGAAVEARANMIFWGFVLTTVFVFAHVVADNLSYTDIVLSLVVGLFYLLATELGSRLFRRTGESGYRKAVLFFLLMLSGAAFFL